MAAQPEFPRFKPLELEDREILGGHLRAYQPQTSELTFTDLYVRRLRNRFEWSVHKDWLLVIGESGDGPYALQPVGPPPRLEVSLELLRWLQEEREASEPRIERADRRYVSEVYGAEWSSSELVRDQFDYVYRIRDLIALEGRKYHSKRNHIRRFLRSHSFRYAEFSEEHLGECLDLLNEWCDRRNCRESPGVQAECEATHEALMNADELDVRGGVVLVDGKVGAFALGEMLNDEMAVVHVEKADDSIPELYPVMNQQFCEKQWRGVPYVNREPDRGEEELRRAKLSYHPVRLEEKYIVRLAAEGRRRRTEMIRTVAPAVVCAVALGVLGCSKPERAHEHRAHGVAARAALRPQETCPVMAGGKIDKSLYVDHNGKRVYFCCGGCIDTFRKDPERYLRVLSDRGEAPVDIPASEQE